MELYTEFHVIAAAIIRQLAFVLLSLSLGLVFSLRSTRSMTSIGVIRPLYIVIMATYFGFMTYM